MPTLLSQQADTQEYEGEESPSEEDEELEEEEEEEAPDAAMAAAGCNTAAAEQRLVVHSGRKRAEEKRQDWFLLEAQPEWFQLEEHHRAAVVSFVHMSPEPPTLSLVCLTLNVTPRQLEASGFLLEDDKDGDCCVSLGPHMVELLVADLLRKGAMRAMAPAAAPAPARVPPRKGTIAAAAGPRTVRRAPPPARAIGGEEDGSLTGAVSGVSRVLLARPSCDRLAASSQSKRPLKRAAPAARTPVLRQPVYLPQEPEPDGGGAAPSVAPAATPSTAYLSAPQVIYGTAAPVVHSTAPPTPAPSLPSAGAHMAAKISNVAPPPPPSPASIPYAASAGSARSQTSLLPPPPVPPAVVPKVPPAGGPRPPCAPPPPREDPGARHPSFPPPPRATAEGSAGDAPPAKKPRRGKPEAPTPPLTEDQVRMIKAFLEESGGQCQLQVVGARFCCKRKQFEEAGFLVRQEEGHAPVVLSPGQDS
eukprot:TRINITY_DN51643_c0_g1_i1.p1 TRINITY_DN51643_c0_g1~~TRINITY_DN51643_c0_g1_i1.p1  ORF type:complete len:475 (+),score=104.08 TRINITY_DN51643_c0_g1_i1:77-1501(+)